MPILKQVISSNIVRAIEHGTFEDTASATILQASVVWHDEMLHHEQYTGESPAMLLPIVEELREQLGWYCAHLSTSMKFDTDVDQNILNSFFEGAKAGAHWGRKIQYGRQPILDFVITS